MVKKELGSPGGQSVNGTQENFYGQLWRNYRTSARGGTPEKYTLPKGKVCVNNNIIL